MPPHCVGVPEGTSSTSPIVAAGHWSSSRSGQTAALLRPHRASPSPLCSSCGPRSSAVRLAGAPLVSASNAPKGSSISSTLGSMANARAIPTYAASCRLKFRGALVGGVTHSHQLQRSQSALLQLIFAFFGAKHPFYRQVNVVVASQPRQQRMVLKYHGTLRARAGNFLCCRRSDPAGGQQARNQVQQGGLATARVPDQAMNSPFSMFKLMSRRAWKRPFCVEHHLGLADFNEVRHVKLLSMVQRVIRS